MIKKCSNVPLIKHNTDPTKTKSNIKETMNSSAPICISSYIKGANANRPNTKGGNRRQASFNHTAGTNSNSGVRRGNSSSGVQNVADIGIVAGQTMNLSRANMSAKDATASGILRSQGAMNAIAS